ncbi:MAG: hypothetical protein FWG79_07770 [Bacteroidales bacterium]|nr:hypothetical protein [Bacteroidales bacterium]
MKKTIFITILIASFATKSFAYCPIPQWCPSAPLHQTLCPGESIDDIEFPSVIAKVLIVTWWTDGTRIHSFEDPPPGIIVSGAASTPLGEREYAWPVSIKGAPTVAGTHHYTVSNTCGVELLHGSITMGAPPTIGMVTPTINQTTVQNIAFGSTLTLTAEPTGTPTPTIQWYSSTTATNSGGSAVSGATGNTFAPPSATANAPNGIYYYAVATNSCGTATTSNTSGRHIVVPACPATTNPTPSDNGCSPTRNGATFTTIGTQFFKTSTIWQISGNGISQEWSDVVLTSNCGKTDFDGGSDYPNYNNDCRENRTTELNETRPTMTNEGGNTANYFGDLFSWCAVINHAATLCPSPWRVPTCQDFINLDIALGGTGINRDDDDAVRDKLIAVSGDAGQFWGGAYVGLCTGTGPLGGQESYAVYWSSSEATATYARRLYFDADGFVLHQNFNSKGFGVPLRCVR